MTEQEPQRDENKVDEKDKPAPSPDNSATLQHDKTELQPGDAREKAKHAAWAGCCDLASQPRILDHMIEELAATGLVGEKRAAKLIYLVLTSRLLERPLCAVVKGPSSSGKNFVSGQVLTLFPPSGFYRLTGMSEKALAYSEEPLAHRTLVVEEAAGLSGGTGAYLLRSLISEGRIRYETVEAGSNGLKPKVLDRPGPTGLLVTTAALNLDAELETRLFSIPISDSRDQTSAVLRSVAARYEGAQRDSTTDLRRWHTLQQYLSLSEHRVVVPYAQALVGAVPPVAVRLRRDIPAVLNLVCAHALLHQTTRDRDDEGHLVATIEDYAVVYELVADLVSQGAEASVPTTVRETVEAVRSLGRTLVGGVPQRLLGEKLNLDKATVSRRVRHANRLGYLVNNQEKRGQPAKLEIGDPLPADVEILPRPETLTGARCGVAVLQEGGRWAAD
jgi:hypothetical protein